eukprot:6074332-Alexandrium_andersonii.AAC.1
MLPTEHDWRAAKHAEMETLLFDSPGIAFPADATAECLRCRALCPVHPPPTLPADAAAFKPLDVVVAGSTYVGYSSMGTRLGSAHPAQRPYVVWKSERHARADAEGLRGSQSAFVGDLRGACQRVEESCLARARPRVLAAMSRHQLSCNTAVGGSVGFWLV